MEYREKMKTEYQWLQEGRIPNEHARWELWKSLNKTFNICAYGSQYFYCHEDDTHVPENLEGYFKRLYYYIICVSISK